jgi:DNA polymerase-3 subunit delta'
MADRSPLALLGHDQLVEPLLRSVREGRAAHAYLVTGPPRVGKGTLARVLAAAFCCAGPHAPCGACAACRRVARGSHPDVEMLSPGGLCDESEHDHATDRSRDVRICQIRRAERLLNLAPFEGRARAVIIDPADALNAQSADAFLKTLEEPPAQTVIILVAAEPWLLPDTVRSRCRPVALCALPVATVERHLADLNASPEDAALLARLSGGHIGWALGALEDSGFREARAQEMEQIEALAAHGRVERFEYAEKLAARFGRSRDEVYTTLSLWAGWWRDVLLAAAGSERGIVNVDRREALAASAGRYQPAAVARFLRALRDARQDLESNVNPRLALEALMLRSPAPKGG